MDVKFFLVPGLNDLLIVDFNYFTQCHSGIDSWCSENLGYNPRQGMLLKFSKITDLELFLLKWNE